MRLEHLLSGDGRLSLFFRNIKRKDRRDVASRDKQNKSQVTQVSQAPTGGQESNLAKVTLYRADVALQTVSMGREVEVLNFSL